jgi:hypothetical protein
VKCNAHSRRERLGQQAGVDGQRGDGDSGGMRVRADPSAPPFHDECVLRCRFFTSRTLIPLFVYLCILPYPQLADPLLRTPRLHARASGSLQAPVDALSVQIQHDDVILSQNLGFAYS